MYISSAFLYQLNQQNANRAVQHKQNIVSAPQMFLYYVLNMFLISEQHYFIIIIILNNAIQKQLSLSVLNSSTNAQINARQHYYTVIITHFCVCVFSGACYSLVLGPCKQTYCGKHLSSIIEKKKNLHRHYTLNVFFKKHKLSSQRRLLLRLFLLTRALINIIVMGMNLLKLLSLRNVIKAPVPGKTASVT